MGYEIDVCDICGEPADGPEAGALADTAVTVCSDECADQALIYPCAGCSAPVADEDELCGGCA